MYKYQHDLYSTAFASSATVSPGGESGIANNSFIIVTVLKELAGNRFFSLNKIMAAKS